VRAAVAIIGLATLLADGGQGHEPSALSSVICARARGAPTDELDFFKKPCVDLAAAPAVRPCGRRSCDLATLARRQSALRFKLGRQQPRPTVRIATARSAPGQPCQDTFIQDRATVILRLGGGEGVNALQLRLTPQRESPVALYALGPDGRWFCDGLPRPGEESELVLAIEKPATGEYKVFVGAHSTEWLGTVPFQLRSEPLPAEVTLHVRIQPEP
jgi:hypothetical protein